MLGAVAAVTLVIYAVLLFALVKLIPITLTLPGIAGMVLTLAVAADANIVIFERIKEEARAGRSIPAAISNGYAKALRTIIDANVVTIGVAFILFTLATAGVKGFAFTLGIGTIVSLFTAVLATSAILGAMARTRIIGSRFAIGARESEGWKFDFVGKSKWFFSTSGRDPAWSARWPSPAWGSSSASTSSRARGSRRRSSAAPTWTRCATRSRRSARRREDPEGRRARPRRATSSRSPPPRWSRAR